MEESLSYPYCRFSSDIYAERLIVLLEENQIPFDVVNEPQGAGTVFLGSAMIPGVVVMIREADAMRVKQLDEKQIAAQAPIEFIEKSQVELIEEQPSEIPESDSEYDKINPLWIAFAYFTALTFTPVGIILGLHFMSARKRQPDMTYRKAYRSAVRLHGRIIFWAGIILLTVGITRMIMLGSRGSFFDAVSYVIRKFTHL